MRNEGFSPEERKARNKAVAAILLWFPIGILTAYIFLVAEPYVANNEIIAMKVINPYLLVDAVLFFVGLILISDYAKYKKKIVKQNE